MNYWSYFSSFNTDIVATYRKIRPKKLVVIDGGAAGEISEPFDIARSVIASVRFEPRGEDEIIKSSEDLYINGGLWSEDVNGVLYLAKDPTTSSI